MRKSLQIVLGCLVCVSFVSVVQADAISGPFATTTPIASTSTDWSSSLSFPKFDSALGTLTAVQLDLNGGLSTQITITNDSSSPSNGNVKTELQIFVQDGGANLLAPEPTIVSNAFGYGLAAGASVTSSLLTNVGSSSRQYTIAAVLDEFNGPGTISLSASTFTQTVLANTGGNTAASQVTSAYLTGNVTYSYIPVPEPSALVLLVAGALGLLVYVGRRCRG